MKIKKIKLIGAVSASIALLTSSVTSITAFADVSPVPGSSFAYDFTASVVDKGINGYNVQVCPGDIAVTFQVTNNPGTAGFGFALFHGEGYNILGSESNAGYHNSPTLAYNPDNNCYIYVIAPEFDAVTTDTIVKYENFSVTVYFRPTEDITNQNSDFKIALTYYDSPNENIEPFDIKPFNVAPDFNISGPSSYEYMVGDIDNNGYISVSDAGNINSIGVKANLLGSRAVEDINKYRLTSEWVTRFPMLPCAEAADVDGNNLVDDNDVDEVLYYYSNNAANVPIESLVGKTKVKTIYNIK